MKTFTGRRRKFLINRNLQYGLLLTSFLQIVLFLALAGLGLFIPLFTRLGGEGPSADVRQAANVLLYLHETFWPVMFMCVVFVGLLSLRTSHKIAGPLSRIAFVLSSVKDGSLPRPRPSRKDDYLIAEIAAANGMLETLRAQVGELQESQTRLREAIAACTDAAGRAPAGEIGERLEDIREKERRVAETLDYFKVI